MHHQELPKEVTSWSQIRLEAADAAGSVHKLGAACKKELRSFNRAIAKNPNANLGLGDCSYSPVCATVALLTSDDESFVQPAAAERAVQITFSCLAGLCLRPYSRTMFA